MTTNPEVLPMSKDECISALAYAIWEKEGRPDGQAEAHWLRSVELVEAEDKLQPGSAAGGDPDWLKREQAIRGKVSAAPAKPAAPSPQVSRISVTKAA